MRRSHCCLAALLPGDKKFAHFCSNCRYPCEPANPSTPSHKEALRNGFAHVLQRFRDGMLPEAIAIHSLEHLFAEQLLFHTREKMTDCIKSDTALVGEMLQQIPNLAAKKGFIDGWNLHIELVNARLDEELQRLGLLPKP